MQTCRAGKLIGRGGARWGPSVAETAAFEQPSMFTAFGLPDSAA